LKLAITPATVAEFGSLLTRERGLKHCLRWSESFDDWSLLTRERGLKPSNRKFRSRLALSLLTRERGLKL